MRVAYRMTRITGPDYAFMCNLINIHTHTGGSMRVAYGMTRMTGPDCAVMCNLINTQAHTYEVEIVSPLSHLIRGFCNKYH